MSETIFLGPEETDHDFDENISQPTPSISRNYLIFPSLYLIPKHWRWFYYDSCSADAVNDETTFTLGSNRGNLAILGRNIQRNTRNERCGYLTGGLDHEGWGGSLMETSTVDNIRFGKLSRKVKVFKADSWILCDSCESADFQSCHISVLDGFVTPSVTKNAGFAKNDGFVWHFVTVQDEPNKVQQRRFRAVGDGHQAERLSSLECFHRAYSDFS